MSDDICEKLHVCTKCGSQVYCNTYMWACPWLNGDENQFCVTCELKEIDEYIAATEEMENEDEATE